MSKNEEFIRFEKDLKESEELRKKYEEVLRSLNSEGIKSDSEFMAKAAGELGYNFTAADIERAAAELQELDPDEMELVAGGKKNPKYNAGEGELCMLDYNCGTMYEKRYVDSDGHNSWCVAFWHCYTAVVHTDTTDNTHDACWSNYLCSIVYLKDTED